MSEWPLIGVRFALYLDLGLAFGWPLFCLYARRGAEGAGGGSLAPPPMAMLGAAGLALSAFGFLLIVALMGGTGLSDINPAVLRVMVGETAIGWAFLARMAALLLVVAAGLLARRARGPALALAAVAGAAALGSLAWNGHAGATEGRIGVLHLGADLLHLWAAGLWLGAIVGLSAMLVRSPAQPAELEDAHRALHGFSTLGALAVATLVATGAVNTLVIAGKAPVADVMASRWAQLLALKLLLFGVMLAFAAANRFRLTPLLKDAVARGDTRRATAALRLSLGFETTAALGVLALVGWLGTLAPPAAG